MTTTTAKLPDKKTLQAVKAAAKALAIKAPSLTTKGKTYEIWMMFEIARNLAGYLTVTPMTHAGVKATNFIARGGPGHIPAKTSTAGNAPCHFEFESAIGERYEIHNSVEHVGKSGEHHELDISVVLRHTAETIRARAYGGPYDGRREVGIELKAFDAGTTLSKAIPRALFGAAVDLDVSVAVQFVFLAGPRGRPITGVHAFHIPRHWLITTAQIAGPSRAFLASYNIGAFDNVTPGANVAAVDDVVNVMRHLL